MTTLYFQHPETRRYTKAPEHTVLEVARSIQEEKHLLRAKHKFSSPSESADYVKARVATRGREVFGMLCLDNRHRLCHVEEITGTIDGCTVHPREAVRIALRHETAAIILYHNHPSGVAEPSTADEMITKRLHDAFRLVDIRLLDHLVIGNYDGKEAPCVSLAERGLI